MRVSINWCFNFTSQIASTYSINSTLLYSKASENVETELHQIENGGEKIANINYTILAAKKQQQQKPRKHNSSTIVDNGILMFYCINVHAYHQILLLLKKEQEIIFSLNTRHHINVL